MFYVHRTKDGTLVPVNEMSDDHLRNYLLMVARELARLRKIIYSEKTVDPLYKTVTTDPDTAATIFRDMIEDLYPYLAETLIRPELRDEVGNLFAKLLGRNGPRVVADDWVLFLDAGIPFGDHNS